MNWTKVGIITVAGLTGITMAAASLAHDGGAGGPGRTGGGERPSFEMLDADGNGILTAEEVKAHQAGMFSAHDTDGDGMLNREELIAAIVAQATERAEAMADRMFRWQDANDDGLISAGEMPGNRMAGLFERMDTDNNGEVSAEEFAAAMDMAETRMKDRGGRGLGQRHGQ